MNKKTKILIGLADDDCVVKRHYVGYICSSSSKVKFEASSLKDILDNLHLMNIVPDFVCMQGSERISVELMKNNIEFRF